MSAATLTASVAAIAARVPEAPPGVGPSRETIAEAVALIAERFRPERIVLFGSRAYGVPTGESDVDLMVVMETPLSLMDQAWRVRESVPACEDLRLHPIVRTPAQVRLGLAERDFFILDAIHQGVTLCQTVRDNQDDRPMGNEEVAEPGEAGGASGLKRSTRDWLRKGEGDYRAISHLLDAPEPFFDLACFHAQRCAEKLLKALLQERVIPFQRTHELTALAARVAPSLPGLAPLAPDLRWLSRYAVAGPVEAERALRIAADVRRIVRADLGLGGEGG